MYRFLMLKFHASPYENTHINPGVKTYTEPSKYERIQKYKIDCARTANATYSVRKKALFHTFSFEMLFSESFQWIADGF